MDPVERRLIPACAGKTLDSADWSLDNRAHPRVCGENTVALRAMLPASGSSPRVRGKPPLTRERPREAGLIPACAGKTSFLVL